MSPPTPVLNPNQTRRIFSDYTLLRPKLYESQPQLVVLDLQISGTRSDSEVLDFSELRSCRSWEDFGGNGEKVLIKFNRINSA